MNRRFSIALTGCLASTSCIVVASPNLEGTEAAPEPGSTSDATGTSAAATSSGASEDSTGIGVDSSSTSTGEVDEDASGQLDAEPFTFYWDATPVDSPIPPSPGIIVSANVYTFATSLGMTPAGVDLDAELASLEEQIDADVPEDASEGIGIVLNGFWDATWCGASAADHEAFAASEFAAGLSDDELPAAWDARAVEILVALIERARETRPNIDWAINGIPWHDYWPVIEQESDSLGTWRDCQMGQPSVDPLFEAIDVLSPRINHFYTGADEEVLERNARYAKRVVETATLSGKPVVPIFEGRYRRSSKTDTNPHMNLPVFEDDLRNFAQAIRVAGASGVVYEFPIDECWNFDEGCSAADPEPFDVAFAAYWEDIVLPILAEIQ